MSRLSFFFTTLIAAVPAAFLGYLCVAAFLFYADALSPILMAVAGITLLLCVAVVAMPVYVLLKTRGRDEPAVKEPETPAEAVSDEFVATEEKPAATEEEDVFVEGDADEFDETPRKK